ncbi:MAG: RIP metalloprotease RseP [Sediminispirochaetaceae bacterium]
MIGTILLGLLGLGIVVFVHELGHFLAAKASGITVEAFSLGWGRILFARRWRGTEYRISMLPIGGYCKMKGEELFKQAIDEDRKEIPHEEGSLFSVPVWKRMITYAAGPLFNFLFAVLVLSIIWYSGFKIHTYDNRVIMISDYPGIFEQTDNPADRAGLQTGDRIISIGDAPVETYSDLQRLIAQSPQETLEMTVLRDDSEWSTTITPELDRDTGAGRIGVSAWVDPVLGEVEPGKSAAAAGLREGDLIVAANGKPIRHTLDLYSVLSDHPSTIELGYERDGSRLTTTLVPLYTEDDKVDLGLSFRGITRTSPRLNPLQALVRGSREAVETFALTLKGIALLFSGVNVQKAVSGPVRITYLVGEVATRGFEQGISNGFITLFRFLSLLSVALCFGNLLPIPALDGGFLVLSVVELIKGNSVSPRTFYRYQTVGFVIIILILFLTTFSDISYLFTN